MTSSASGNAPRTAGHALHDVLDRVRNSGEPTIQRGWAAVLDAQPNTLAWAQRHAEVVNLYRTLLLEVSSLPEGQRAREWAERYAAAWYRAVVWQSHWQNNQEPASKIIDDSTLDHLGQTAEILQLRMSGTAASPTDEGIARLRHELEEWLGVLEETADIPKPTREEIAGQIRHVLWLLDNIETFGCAPVARETRMVVGRITEATATRDPQSNTGKKWAARAGALIVALTLFTDVADHTTHALEAVQQTVQETRKVTSEIMRVESGHPGLSHSPAALPAGNGSQPDAESEVGGQG